MGVDFSASTAVSVPSRLQEQFMDARCNNDRPHFHLNWNGIQYVMERLVEVEVLDDQWRAPKGGFCDRDCYNEATERRCDKCEAFKSTQGLDGRVAAFKFGSNDGWLIGPEECRAVADGLYGWLDVNNEPDWVRRFADFNRACVDLGGYRVW